MFDSVSATIEAGEAFAQGLSPATLCLGSSRFPCKIGRLQFHEALGAGGIRLVREMHVTLRRLDVNAAISFTRGQEVTVIRKVRGAGSQVSGANGEESLALKVGDANGSDAVNIVLTLERPAV